MFYIGTPILFRRLLRLQHPYSMGTKGHSHTGSGSSAYTLCGQRVQVGRSVMGRPFTAGLSLVSNFRNDPEVPTFLPTSNCSVATETSTRRTVLTGSLTKNTTHSYAYISRLSRRRLAQNLITLLPIPLACSSLLSSSPPQIPHAPLNPNNAKILRLFNNPALFGCT